MSLPRPVLVIGGPTAVGKTQIAVRLSEMTGLPIISADSRQVYRYMDIGTAKPEAGDLSRAPHELIDIRNPDEEFNVSEFLAEIGRAEARLPDGAPMIVAGGTGLYIRALLEGLAELPAPDRAFRDSLDGIESALLHDRLKSIDPAAAAAIHPRNRVRTVRALEIVAATGRTMSSIIEDQRMNDSFCGKREYEYFVLLRPRPELDSRISSRVDGMIGNGLVDEVRGLLDMGFDPSLPSMTSIGYREVLNHLSGRAGLGESVESIKVSTRQFSRRQMTWFRSEKRTRPIDLCEKGFDATLSEIYEAWERLHR